ncbi:MAG TPA: hypothetical protein VKB80_14845 [Kofleriaceae bacterium]|nr:hypothetical protein [Kofleriaceae bacterium]
MKKILSTLLFAACMTAVPLAAGAGEPKAAPSKKADSAEKQKSSTTTSKARTSSRHKGKHKAKSAVSKPKEKSTK